MPRGHEPNGMIHPRAMNEHDAWLVGRMFAIANTIKRGHAS